MPLVGQGMTVTRVKMGFANLHVMERSDGMRVTGGVSAVDALCSCGRAFTARATGPASAGSFEERIGHVAVQCPACGYSETFTNQALATVAS